MLTDLFPLQSSKPKGSGSDSTSKLSGASGLALQDSKERAKQLDAELIAEGLDRRQQSHNDASTSATNGSHHREPDSSMHRSHRRDEDGRPGHNRDSPDIDRHWDKDRKRQHRSRSRDRHNKRRRTVSPEDRDRGRYGDRDRRGPAGNRPPPAPLLEKPERGGVHKGRVSGLMDFGCFVELQGFKSRVEGLVHITNLSKTRYNQLQVWLLADPALDFTVLVTQQLVVLLDDMLQCYPDPAYRSCEARADAA